MYNKIMKKIKDGFVIIVMCFMNLKKKLLKKSNLEEMTMMLLKYNHLLRLPFRIVCGL